MCLTELHTAIVDTDLQAKGTDKNAETSVGWIVQSKIQNPKLRMGTGGWRVASGQLSAKVY